MTSMKLLPQAPRVDAVMPVAPVQRIQGMDASADFQRELDAARRDVEQRKTGERTLQPKEGRADESVPANESAPVDDADKATSQPVDSQGDADTEAPEDDVIASDASWQETGDEAAEVDPDAEVAQQEGASEAAYAASTQATLTQAAPTQQASDAQITSTLAEQGGAPKPAATPRVSAPQPGQAGVVVATPGEAMNSGPVLPLPGQGEESPLARDAEQQSPLLQQGAQKATGQTSATLTGESSGQVASPSTQGAEQLSQLQTTTSTQNAAASRAIHAPNPAAQAPTHESTEAPSANDRLNAARVARGLNNALLQKGGGVTLRLTPAELGTVRIQLQLSGTTVNAQIQAESGGARSMLQQQLSSLRQSLEAQGLSVDRLSVQPLQTSGASSAGTDHESSQSDGRSRGQYAQQQRQQQQREQASDAPSFAEQLLAGEHA